MGKMREAGSTSSGVGLGGTRCIVTVAAVMLAWAGHALAVSYSIDGTGNHQSDPNRGSTHVQLQREASGAHYGDTLDTPAGGTRPSPRLISNAIFDQPTSIPNTRGLTDMVWVWGQFIDHDIGLTEAGTTEPLNIPVPSGDPYFDPNSTGTQQIFFDRSSYDPNTGSAATPAVPRQQTNQITAWLDGSGIYGSDPNRADWLRSGVDGRLKTAPHGTGDLLPFNDGTQPNAGGLSTSLFVAGDVRANENLALTAMHTVWLREHNRLADEIAAANSAWSDDQVFDAARGQVIAQIQAITFNEWLPALLGPGAITTYGGYNDQTDPGLSNAFSTAAYRIGHTMVSPQLLRLNPDGSSIPEGPVALRDAFFRPDRIVTDGGVDPVLVGLCHQFQQRIDAKVIDDLRNFLFGPPAAGGFDLASLNIQRGRDHGLADYNTMRIDFGLSPVSTYDQITPDPSAQLALLNLYGSVNNIDPWVGGLLEAPFGDSALGELFHTILVDQFSRIRNGDRFWYENATAGEGRSALQSTTLSDVIMRNTGIGFMPFNSFVVPLPTSTMLLVVSSGALLMRRGRRGRVHN